jgi:hypothetical protein
MQAAVNQGACWLFAIAEHKRHLKFEKTKLASGHIARPNCTLYASGYWGI